MEDWYNSADFIISGSHYEGSGVSVCEAMSCGCIPLVTDILSFRKITGYGKCGLLYERGNVNALLDVLLKTKHLNIHFERKKVLEQFDSDLSFDAIAKQLNEKIIAMQQDNQKVS
jgi:glycosyltransferase involved in cell wall biosynthesis